jgi:nucleotide-binding universal stress UspA family protein
MKIVIGYNHTPGAQGAIKDLTRAGLPLKGGVTVLTALDNLSALAESNFNARGEREPAMAESYQIDTTRLLTETCACAEEGAKALRTALPGWEVQAKSRVGTASWLLIHEAEHANADLIVIGSKGHSLLGRIFFGSVSHFVVNHAPCSVRVSRVPEGEQAEPPRVIVGIDGSSNSELAVEEVSRRVWPSGTQVHIVAALDVDIYNPDMSIEQKQAALETALGLAKEKIAASGLEVTTLMKPGFARGILLDEAKSWKADSIFVGAIGHSLVDRLLIGSTSAAIAAEAPCSVEIVRKANPVTVEG